MNRGNFFTELKRRNAICRKISEDRYRFRRWTALFATTPAPGVVTISHAVEKDREILVLFAARCSK